MAENSSQGISIEKIAIDDLSNFAEAKQAERHDRHSFHLLENGVISMEIDFRTYEIKAPAITYMHPNQVHRIIAVENALISSWAINNENLNNEYLEFLEEITPAQPLALNEEEFSTINRLMASCQLFLDRKNDKLYHSALRDSINALVALIISHYLEKAGSTDRPSRFDITAKAFRQLLENNFITIKSPAVYAQKLSISSAYLNECVKQATGHSVSYHIQQRIILEAKRLLYHSDKSVKEISAELGYDDYPYFSRLFTKVTGMTALAFRGRNHE